MLFSSIGTLAEVGIMSAFARWKARQTTVAVLQCQTRSSRKFPLLDNQIQKRIGHPSKFVRMQAQKMIQIIRFAVSTQAFEYAVQGMLNPQSKMRQKRRRITEVSTYL